MDEQQAISCVGPYHQWLIIWCIPTLLFLVLHPWCFIWK